MQPKKIPLGPLALCWEKCERFPSRFAGCRIFKGGVVESHKN